MSRRSPTSLALHDTFESSFLPLLQQVGFTPAKLPRVKPGLVVAMAARPLDDVRRVEATLWCDGGSGSHLRFRFDVVGPFNGVECWGQVELKVPWPDSDARFPASLSTCADEFHPETGPDRIQRAVEFLAGAFAASADRIADAVPELRGPLAIASATPSWRLAAERARELWNNRYVRGTVEDRPVTVTIVFVGSKLLLLEAEGARFSFRFDTRTLDPSRPISVSGWVGTAAGTKVPTKLTSGGATWTFNERGDLGG